MDKIIMLWEQINNLSDLMRFFIALGVCEIIIGCEILFAIVVIRVAYNLLKKILYDIKERRW